MPLKKVLKSKLVKAKQVEQTETTIQKRTDLREIMDYSKDFSIFYSGVENETYFNLVQSMGVRHFLMSYEYIQNKGFKVFQRMKDIEGVRLFIDSGAFTYMTNPEYSAYTVEMWETQIIEYLDWARKHRKHIFAIADLDLQILVGEKQVKEWRKKYFEPFMLETGIPVCMVWHTPDGIEAWEYMCKRYPYVAMSLTSEGRNIDIPDIKNKLRIAAKYNTLVQGMGSTRTAVLPQLPFYTVDSTTWLVGLQYGELNFWNKQANRMQRLKKEQWQGEYLTTIVRETGLNREALLEENVPEMIKANVYAFIEAEKWIRRRLRPYTYWKKPNVTKVDLDNVDYDFFPSCKWFDKGADNRDYRDVAKRLNINPELDKELLMTLIEHATVFCNWNNEEYADFTKKYMRSTEFINQLHDEYVNVIRPAHEDRIEDLIEFFTENVSGKNNKLILLGTNFDMSSKEREEYLEDDEECEDLDEEEVLQTLSELKLLPESGAEDISRLDDEIFKQAGLVPVRDNEGRYVTAHAHQKSNKQLYSEKYPKLFCTTCVIGNTCEHYHEGYVCVHHKLLKRFTGRNADDVVDAIISTIDDGMSRYQRAMIHEIVTGGAITPQVTELGERNLKNLMLLRELHKADNGEIFSKHTKVNADGSREEHVSIKNPSEGGVLEKLFSAMTNRQQADPESVKEDIIETSIVEGAQVVIDLEG